MLAQNNFTPTEKRILEVLSDGREHKLKELVKCMADELSTTSTVLVHMTHIRAKLRPIGEDILCYRTGGNITYRHVRVVSIAE